MTSSILKACQRWEKKEEIRKNERKTMLCTTRWAVFSRQTTRLSHKPIALVNILIVSADAIRKPADTIRLSADNLIVFLGPFKWHEIRFLTMECRFSKIERE